MTAFTITVSDTGSTQFPAGVINQGDQLDFAAGPGGPTAVQFKSAKESPFGYALVAVPSSAPVTSASPWSAGRSTSSGTSRRWRPSTG